uniref:Bidirectional sugar transporter SWEET n=1 Tax=Glycine max TaxID=3847 RepID=C6THM3_SOYBN|nr:unknown [Glycine max]
MDVAHFLFGIFGNASALFLFLAPVITFKRIIKNRSTEKFSGIPYVMTLLNCLLSAWYGLPFVSPHNILVSTVNGTGSFIEIIYVLIFIVLAPRRRTLKFLVSSPSCSRCSLQLFSCPFLLFMAIPESSSVASLQPYFPLSCMARHSQL